MLDDLKFIRNCVIALKACDNGTIWNEADKPTFYKMLDQVLEEAINKEMKFNEVVDK